jgi:type III restriction enzyme
MSLRYELQSGEIRETEIFGRGDIGAFTERISQQRPVSDFRPSTIRKALDRHSFYRFSNLRRFFPNLSSIEDFISNKAYLASLRVEITGSRYALEHLSSDDGVHIIYQLLEELRVAIEKGWTEYRGTKEFVAIRLKDILRDRDLQIAVDAASDQERGLPMSHPNNDVYKMNLREVAWYIFDENYGTSEEKGLVKYVGTIVERLEEKYSDIYLLRNEKDVKLYRFSDGKAIEPDFLLFLSERKTGRKMLYQLFIESKGEHLLEHDQWKEEFLLSIEGEAKTEHIHEDAEVRIIGLPFYTSALGHQPDFKDTFRKKLGLT